MNDDSFTKLFNYMQSEFGKVNDRLEKTALQDSLDKLTNTIDAFVKRLDDQETE